MCKDPQCFDELLAAGFELPGLERGLEVARHAGRGEAAPAARLRELWALREASQIEQAARLGGRSGPGRL